MSQSGDKMIPHIRGFYCSTCGWYTCQQHRSESEPKHDKCVYCRRAEGTESKVSQLAEALGTLSNGLTS